MTGRWASSPGTLAAPRWWRGAAGWEPLLHRVVPPFSRWAQGEGGDCGPEAAVLLWSATSASLRPQGPQHARPPWPPPAPGAAPRRGGGPGHGQRGGQRCCQTAGSPETSARAASCTRRATRALYFFTLLKKHESPFTSNLFLGGVCARSG